MWNVSASPQSALASLLRWRNLPETQATLLELAQHAQRTLEAVKRPPTCEFEREFRHELLGEHRGILTLETLLNNYEAELRQQIAVAENEVVQADQPVNEDTF